MLYRATRDYISSLSDQALLEYLVVGTREYELEAVEFAQEEFQRRNLSAEDLKIFSLRARQRVTEMQAEANARAQAPLDRAGKLFWFALGFLNVFALITLVVAEIYARQGENRKAWQMRVSLAWGFLTEIFLILQFIKGGWLGQWSLAAVLAFCGFVAYVAVKRPPKTEARGFAVIQQSRDSQNYRENLSI